MDNKQCECSITADKLKLINKIMLFNREVVYLSQIRSKKHSKMLITEVFSILDSHGLGSYKIDSSKCHRPIHKFIKMTYDTLLCDQSMYGQVRHLQLSYFDLSLKLVRHQITRKVYERMKKLHFTC